MVSEGAPADVIAVYTNDGRLSHQPIRYPRPIIKWRVPTVLDLSSLITTKTYIKASFAYRNRTLTRKAHLYVQKCFRFPQDRVSVGALADVLSLLRHVDEQRR